jgi:hypothetical protein
MPADSLPGLNNCRLLVPAITVACGNAGSTVVAGTATSADYDLSGISDLFVVVSGTGPTGDVVSLWIQDTMEGDTTYYDLVAAWNIAAGAASVQALPTCLSNTSAVIGSGTSPLLAQGQCRGTRWGGRFRLVSKTGANVNAGQTYTAKIFGR